MGRGEAEHHAPVRAVHAVDLLGDPGRHPFAHERYDEHHRGHGQGVAAHYHSHIDHHPHTYQEVGDEQGVAHKLDAVHQRGVGGDVAVEYQAGEEGAEHRFEADGSGYPGAEKHHHHHIDILRDLLAVELEKPPRDARIGVEHCKAVERQLEA